MVATGGYRKYISVFGRRNAGKSSLVNHLIGQEVSIVSESPGTTTDPVYRSMELHPVGPVTIVDTAGIDDAGKLGELRIDKAKKVLYKTDLGILVLSESWSSFEDEFVKAFERMDIPYVVVINKTDTDWGWEESAESFSGIPHCFVSTLEKTGIEELKDLIRDVMPVDKEIPLLSDMVKPGETILLVVPIDLGAPKGRLIMPQVEAIRETLDGEAICVVVKERELNYALEQFKNPPALVVADSHLISRVVADVPEEIPLTTFSILEARHKGDLQKLVMGVTRIDKLKSGSKVVIMESCSHVPQTEDIGRVKIPRWITNHAGGGVSFEVISGKEFPYLNEDVDLIVHCGACNLTREMMNRRIKEAERRGIPIANYGVTISYLHGVLERVLRPFPEIHSMYINEMEDSYNEVL